MRILGGTLGGRRFYPPAKKWPTRPTTDISKEALYNILQNNLDFSSLRVLDIFGGTGNHAFEMASRGAPDITYVDNFRGAVQFVDKQSKEWNLEAQISIRKMDAKKFLNSFSDRPYDFIFAGPPYGLSWLDSIPSLVFEHKVLASPDGLFVLEHDPSHDFTGHPNFIEQRKYGQTHFAFFGFTNA